MCPLDREAITDHWVGVHVLGTAAHVELSEPLKLRLFCHFLLTQLPDAGLPEAVETLAEMWRFYREPPVQTPALPPPSSWPVTLGAACVRPVFPVTED